MLISNVDDTHVQGIELEDNIHNGQGIIGSFCKNIGKIQLINLEEEYNHLNGTEIKIENQGTWYINKITPVQEKINIKLDLFDLSYRFDRIYDLSEEIFPCKVREWAQQICDAVGVQYEDLDFPNADFILQVQPFLEAEATFRDAMSMIAGNASFVKVDPDDICRIRWFDRSPNLIIKEGVGTNGTDLDFWSQLVPNPLNSTFGFFPQGNGIMRVHADGTSTGNWRNMYLKPAAMPNWKPNTQYTIFVEMLKRDIRQSKPLQGQALYINQVSNSLGLPVNVSIKDMQAGEIKKILTISPATMGSYLITPNGYFEDGANYTFEFRVMILEGNWTNIDIPFIPFIEGSEPASLTILNDWFSLKQNEETTPVNVTVLGRGVAEDNIYFPDPLPENPFELRIDNNQIHYFNREEMIEEIYNRVVGFKYRLMTMTTYGIPDFRSGSRIVYTDINGQVISTIVMNHKKVFNGGWKSTFNNPELKETSTKFQFAGTNERRVNRVEIEVDKNGEEIRQIAEQTIENSQGIINNQNLIVQNAESTINTIRSIGGNNNIQDSALYKNDNNEWIKSTDCIYELISNVDTKKNTTSQRELRLFNGTIQRDITLIQGKEYNIAFKWHKEAIVPGMVSYIRLYSSSVNYVDYLYTTEQSNREELDFNFIATTNNFTIEYYSDHDNLFISDMRITAESKQVWSQYFDEIMGIGHALDATGLLLTSLSGIQTKNKLDSESILIHEGTTLKAEVSTSRIYGQESKVENKMQIGNMGMIKLDDNNYIIAKVV